MSQMVVVTPKRKMLLRMSVVEMKDGVDSYFFRADKSDCNGKGDEPWVGNKNIPSMPPRRSVL